MASAAKKRTRLTRIDPAEARADAALDRVRAIGYRFAGTEERLSHGAPSFFVRGKMFLTFVDDHHGDGRLAVWCKSTPERQRELARSNPERFFVPPYVGVKGWVGILVNEAVVDWVELAILVEEAWVSTAPPKVQRGEGVPPPGPPPKAPKRVTTDRALARELFERLEAICRQFPSAVCEREARHATFRAGSKVFVYFLDNHHGDGIISACVRGDRAENAALVRDQPKRFYSPAYIGPKGWLGVRLDVGKVDWKGLEARVAASYAAVAPKRGTPGPHSTRPKRRIPRSDRPRGT
ncbi:MAG TPA: MmcQ/YjbR family DNA-binding protein [Polyangiaceae bacterium]|jgi:hypothetical protein